MFVGAIPAWGAEPDCARCHEAEAAAHEGTRHADAFTNPSFQAAFSRWRDPWCTSCHRPEGGVGCAACHADGEEIRTAHEPSALAEAMHPLVVVPDLGTTACLGCHQFDAEGGGEAVQTTGDEHAAWTGSETCASCHQPDHALRGARDLVFLRDHVGARVERTPRGLVATVSVRAIGHQFPTGDPWRRLVLEVLRGDEVAASWVAARRVSGVGAEFHEVSDRRLPPPDAEGNAEKSWFLGNPDATRWRLTYRLVDPDHGLEGAEASTEVASGPLP